MCWTVMPKRANSTNTLGERMTPYIILFEMGKMVARLVL